MPRLPAITPVAATLDDLDLVYVERLQSGTDVTNPANNVYKTAPIFKRDAAAAFRATARAGLDKTSNYTAVAADCGRVITVNASSGAITVTVPVGLGSTAKMWNAAVERSLSDATSNPITVVDDAGTPVLVAQITAGVSGRTVPRVNIQTDGVAVTSPVQS